MEWKKMHIMSNKRNPHICYDCSYGIITVKWIQWQQNCQEDRWHIELLTNTH